MDEFRLESLFSAGKNGSLRGFPKKNIRKHEKKVYRDKTLLSTHKFGTVEIHILSFKIVINDQFLSVASTTRNCK